MACFLQKAGKCFQLIDPKLMNNKNNEGKVRVYKELKTSWKQVENNSDHLITSKVSQSLAFRNE